MDCVNLDILSLNAQRKKVSARLFLPTAISLITPDCSLYFRTTSTYGQPAFFVLDLQCGVQLKIIIHIGVDKPYRCTYFSKLCNY